MSIYRGGGVGKEEKRKKIVFRKEEFEREKWCRVTIAGFIVRTIRIVD